jgi:ABC-2 type transport system permease protein
MRDIVTVMWKEQRGLLRQRGSRARVILTLAVPMGAFGLWVPAGAGAEFPSREAYFASISLPVLAGMLTIPDSVAGERERHTLPTLLASRLSDQAIVLGKAAVAIALSWGFTLAVLALAIVVANASAWDGELIMYSWRTAVSHLVLSLLFAGLPVAAGILISLRSASVQEAQQTLAAVIMLPPVALIPMLLVLVQFRPDLRPQELYPDIDSTVLFFVVVLVLMSVNATLFALALWRFRRETMLTT